MSLATSAAYLLGREPGYLQPPYRAQDRAFLSERLDGRSIEGADFQHCTFANVSFKKSAIRSSRFLDCVFIGCYFRRADLADSAFVGCRFFECNFSHVAIKASHFPYSTFHGCQRPFNEVENSLPSEPNIRQDLARNLYLESTRLGLAREAQQYRMVEIRAREEHLHAAIVGRSLWYREHFDSFARIRAGLELASSLVNRWMWGYGEHSRRLVGNFIVLTLMVFPFLYYLSIDGFAKPGGGSVSPWDLILFSVATMVPSGIETGIEAVGTAAQILAVLEALVGLIAVALFASHILRWRLHR